MANAPVRPVKRNCRFIVQESSQRIFAARSCCCRRPGFAICLPASCTGDGPENYSYKCSLRRNVWVVYPDVVEIIAFTRIIHQRSWVLIEREDTSRLLGKEHSV